MSCPPDNPASPPRASADQLQLAGSGLDHGEITVAISASDYCPDGLVGVNGTWPRMTIIVAPADAD